MQIFERSVCLYYVYALEAKDECCDKMGGRWKEATNQAISPI